LLFSLLVPDLLFVPPPFLKEGINTTSPYALKEFFPRVLLLPQRSIFTVPFPVLFTSSWVLFLRGGVFYGVSGLFFREPFSLVPKAVACCFCRRCQPSSEITFFGGSGLGEAYRPFLLRDACLFSLALCSRILFLHHKSMVFFSLSIFLILRFFLFLSIRNRAHSPFLRLETFPTSRGPLTGPPPWTNSF